MPRVGGNPQNLRPSPCRGRPKGSKDKIPREIKARVLHVWERLQKDGNTSLLGVARADPQWFYETFGKLLIPREVTGTVKLEQTYMALAVQVYHQICGAPGEGPAMPVIPEHVPGPDADAVIDAIVQEAIEDDDRVNEA